jgi:single-strand DNA-binding protein
MNKVFLVGNLTRDPELRNTREGIPVCSFTVAVNRRRSANAEAGQPEADFFRVTAWRQLGEICAKYLAKGRKVSIVGSVSAQAFAGSDGQPRASLEVTADDVEFLTPKGEGSETHVSGSAATAAGSVPQNNGFVQVDEDELPF